MKKRKLEQDSSGQALMETVLLMPLLLMIVLNAVNFGYFFLMALNITSAARSSGLYSIMGGATPSAIALPKAGPETTATSVSYLAYQDLTGAVYSPSTNAGVQVCSPSVGVLNAGTTTMQTNCASYGSVGTFPSAEADPELNSGNTAPAFLLNRVDVAYQFSPPIPLMPFNLVNLASPACTSTGGV
ncbi:MAG: TadE family protein, partial [Acidobacteriaceae bacterium]|nr:TadE family protein [Acidobacteriaceae bacterium]